MLFRNNTLALLRQLRREQPEEFRKLLSDAPIHELRKLEREGVTLLKRFREAFPEAVLEASFKTQPHVPPPPLTIRLSQPPPSRECLEIIDLQKFIDEVKYWALQHPGRANPRRRLVRNPNLSRKLSVNRPTSADKSKPRVPEPVRPVNTARTVTQAPAPPREVGGLGLAPYQPKPTEVPNDPPMYFPSDLWPRTNVILLKAQRRFPLQTQTVELCKHIVSEMTPLFVEAVKAGNMKAAGVLREHGGGMEDLLHLLLVHNDPGPQSGWGISNAAYRLGQEVRKSPEWLELAKKMAKTTGASKQPTALEFAPHVLLSNPLTAHDAGSSATVNIEPFSMATAKGNLCFNSGSIIGLSYGTLYNIYFDDPHSAFSEEPRTVAYQASTRGIIAGIGGRFFVGSIHTPVRGGPPTVGNENGGAGVERSSGQGSPAENNEKTAQSAERKSTSVTTIIGRNIDKLRKECGWSLNTLSQKVGIDKKLVLSHVNKGARPTPRILKDYAQAFTQALGRTIIAPDLEQ